MIKKKKKNYPSPHMAWIHFKGEGTPKKKTSWCRANRQETESGKKSRRFTCLVPSP